MNLRIYIYTHIHTDIFAHRRERHTIESSDAKHTRAVYVLAHTAAESDVVSHRRGHSLPAGHSTKYLSCLANT